jgi:ammonium transporter, Amt family
MRQWWKCVGLIAMAVGLAMSVESVRAQDAEPPAAVATETPAAAEMTAPAPDAPIEPAAAAAAAPAAAPDPIAILTVAVDTLWVIIAGMLVFFMNMGFACVESGMCRAKNCVNILSKNFVVFAASTLAFWVLGWGIMFGSGTPWYGTDGLLLVSGKDTSPLLAAPATGADPTATYYSGDYGSIAWSGVPLWAKFFFQLVFAGTAATIVSGAVAERIKYGSFIVFTLIMGTVIYPVVGHWIWGGGYLASIGFFDFAGSTQVHSIGGWAALAGIIALGPRIGKYGADGRVNAIPGHNMSLATIGCLVLWLGWFGFNPGSTMGIASATGPTAVAHICNTTNIAAAIATLTATATAWILLGKPDLGMTLNGCLAGLVAITAPCAYVSIEHSAVIGAIAGVLVVVGVIGFDRLKIDDPVGATSVHLLNGVFGTICVGLFGQAAIAANVAAGVKDGLFINGSSEQLIAQLTGVAYTAAYVFPVSLIFWYILKFTIGIRVSHEEEIQGLDIGEHGHEAYPGFVMQN